MGNTGIPNYQRNPCSLSSFVCDIQINPRIKAEKFCHSLNMTKLEVMPGKLRRKGDIDDLSSDDDAFNSDNSMDFGRIDTMAK